MKYLNKLAEEKILLTFRSKKEKVYYNEEFLKLLS